MADGITQAVLDKIGRLKYDARYIPSSTDCPRVRATKLEGAPG